MQEEVVLALGGDICLKHKIANFVYSNTFCYFTLLAPQLLLCHESPPEDKHQHPGEELDKSSQREASQCQDKHGLGQAQHPGS